MSNNTFYLPQKWDKEFLKTIKLNVNGKYYKSVVVNRLIEVSEKNRWVNRFKIPDNLVNIVRNNDAYKYMYWSTWLSKHRINFLVNLFKTTDDSQNHIIQIKYYGNMEEVNDITI